MSTVTRKIYTLVFLRDLSNGRILLGKKKRGFGEGKWNGLGGKVEANESIAEGAIREVREESGIEALKVEQKAYLEFKYQPHVDMIMECHIFTCTEFTGQLVETEEMRSEWFEEESVPFEKMWRDDIFWLPHVIGHKYVRGYFIFAANHEDIIHKELNVFDTLDQLQQYIAH